METLVAWISIILFFLIIAGIFIFFIQRRKLKILAKKIESIEEVVDIQNNKNIIEIELNLIKRKILTGSNEELSKYTQRLYFYSHYPSISGNFDKLEELDIKTIEYGIIRMQALEDNFDLSKFLAPTIAILLAALSAYSDFFQKVFLKDSYVWQFVFNLVVIVGSFIYVSIIIGETRGKRLSAIYFKSILQYAKEQKK